MCMLYLQDVSTLGVVNVRFSGNIATVKVERNTDERMNPTPSSINLLDQPEGGANNLNINRFLHMPIFIITKQIKSFEKKILNFPFQLHAEFDNI